MVSEDLRQRLARIRLVLLDVDGILTDGRLLWLGDEVGWGRFFHVSDGYGIKLLLRNQLPVGLISGSDNVSTRERIKLLGIPMAFLGSEDKREAWTQALAQAGRLALPYLASPMEPLPKLEENLARYREACEAAGRQPPSDVPIMRTVFVAEDVSALARVSAALESQLQALAKTSSAALRSRVASAALEDWALVGEPAAVRDQVAALRERFGMTHLIVRAQIPGVDPAELEASVDRIAALG